MQREKSVYGDPTNRAEMLDNMRVLRRRFLRYKDAEIVYSLEHKKLIEFADDAGALYRQGNTVLINSEIFDEYLERFHQLAGMYKVNGNRERKTLEEREGES